MHLTLTACQSCHHESRPGPPRLPRLHAPDVAVHVPALQHAVLLAGLL